MHRLRATLVVVFIWLVSCATAAYMRVTAIRSDPAPSDIYDQTWTYQLLLFSGTRLPYWLVALALLLIVVLLGTKKTGSS